MVAQLGIGRAKQWTVAVVGALVLSVVLVLSSASPAHAIYKQFCWGKTLGGKPATCSQYPNDWLVQYLTEVDGSGAQHSVCVWAKYTGVRQCSAGPNQGVYNNTPDGSYPGPTGEQPVNWGYIENNAAGSNTVYGSIDYCENPC